MEEFQMKKKLLVTAVALSAVIFAGCSQKEGKTESGGSTTISVFNIKTETAEQMDKLVKDFEKANPKIKVNMTTVGGGTDATAALQAKFSSGDEPSLFTIGGLSDVKTWKHTLVDLKDTKLAGLAIEKTLEGATADGKVYGVPMNIEGYGWLVNKEIFKKAGVPIDTIKSYDDFKKAVETLDAKKSDLGLKSVFAYSGGETWVSGQFSSNFIAPEFNNSLQETYDAKTLALTYGDKMKNYLDLAIKYNASPLQSMDYSTSVEELFASEKVAVIHQGNWIVPTLNSLDKNFAKDKLGIIPMFVADETDGKIVAGPAWYWAVNSKKSKAEVAASEKFIEYMYTDKNAMKQIVDDFQFIPAYTNFSSDDIKDPLSKEIYTYLSDKKTVPWVHNAYPDGFAENVVGVQVQAYAADKTDWPKFTKTITDTWAEKRK